MSIIEVRFFTSFSKKNKRIKNFSFLLITPHTREAGIFEIGFDRFKDTVDVYKLYEYRSTPWEHGGRFHGSVRVSYQKFCHDFVQDMDELAFRNG